MLKKIGFLMTTLFILRGYLLSKISAQGDPVLNM